MSRRVVLAAGLLASAAVADARSVDYAPDDTAMKAAAAELKIAPIAPLPERGTDDVALKVDAAADHEVLALGMYCSAYKVLNPVSALVPRIASAWDRDGQLAANGGSAAVSLHVTSGRSYRRCVEVGEANVRCIAKVTLAGTIEGGGRTMPIMGEAERDASVGGFCGQLARGIGVVSREAAIALIADARTKLAVMR